MNDLSSYLIDQLTGLQAHSESNSSIDFHTADWPTKKSQISRLTDWAAKEATNSYEHALTNQLTNRLTKLLNKFNLNWYALLSFLTPLGAVRP